MPDKKPLLRFDDPVKKYRRHKGYRKLVVDEHQFQWRVYDGGRVVLIAPDDSRSSFVLNYRSDIEEDDEGVWWDEEFQQSITPRDVVPYAKAWIRCQDR